MGEFRSEGRRFGARSGGFNRGRSRNFGRDRSSGRERGPREMHSATCDKCGKQCEVPFKPTEGKPIFCDECFKKNDSRGSRENRPSGDLTQINAKLDKIIKILSELEVDTDDDADEEEPEEVEEESK